MNYLKREGWGGRLRWAPFNKNEGTWARFHMCSTKQANNVRIPLFQSKKTHQDISMASCNSVHRKLVLTNCHQYLWFHLPPLSTVPFLSDRRWPPVSPSMLHPSIPTLIYHSSAKCCVETPTLDSGFLIFQNLLSTGILLLLPSRVRWKNRSLHPHPIRSLQTDPTTIRPSPSSLRL